MNPNDCLEKRPRPWDISVRPTNEKKRPSHEKKRAAFSAKQLVLVLRRFSSFRQLFSLHPSTFHPPLPPLRCNQKITHTRIPCARMRMSGDSFYRVRKYLTCVPVLKGKKDLR